MSKMGQFVYEVQEIVCDNFNEPFEVVEAKIMESHIAYPEYAVTVAREFYNEIISDLENFYDAATNV